MNENFSFLHLIVQASWVVQLVMLILVAASVASWAVIVQKVKALRTARQDNEAFESDFWSGSAIAEIYQNIGRKAERTAMERIFVNGMREFIKLHERQLDPDTQVDGARRAMRVSCQRELDHIDSHTSLLASVGSVAPYIGLFGTVWGIMHAFVGLAALEQVTLSTVAPGIAEALVATAMGLFAAIPAVLGYNRFTRDIDRIAMQWDNFTDEFSNLLQRQIPHPAGTGPGFAATSAPEFSAPVPHSAQAVHAGVHPGVTNPYEADQYRSAPSSAAEPHATYGYAPAAAHAPAPAPAAPRSPFAPTPVQQPAQAQHPAQAAHPSHQSAPAPLANRPGAALPGRLPAAPRGEEHPRAGELFDPKRMAGRPGQREI